jgi:hypothetical protein
MRYCLAIAGMLCFLVIRPEVAAAYDVVGSGVWPCDTWTEGRKSNQANVSEQWVLGFLSGIGFMGHENANPLNKLAPEVVFAWVDRYCQRRPHETIEHAGASFYMEHPR